MQLHLGQGIYGFRLIFIEVLHRGRALSQWVPCGQYPAYLGDFFVLGHARDLLDNCCPNIIWASFTGLRHSRHDAIYRP